MAGIAGIVQKRLEEPKFDGERRQDLWLKDGDVAAVTFVPTGGDDGDHRLDQFVFKSYTALSDTGSKQYRNCFCDHPMEDGSCAGYCPQDSQMKKEFGIWAYVHSIEHAQQNTSQQEGAERWEERRTPSGGSRFVEKVEDFKVFHRGFGRNDSFFNQLVGIYDETEDLRKNVSKISRKGASLDTVYTISLTQVKSPVTAEKWAEAEELVPIKEYMSKHYGCDRLKPGGGGSSTVSSSPGLGVQINTDDVEEVSDETLESLFGKSSDSDDGGIF